MSATEHELDHDLDRCQCGGQWVWFESYAGRDPLPGAYGCEVAGHEHAVAHPRDARGRVIEQEEDDED